MKIIGVDRSGEAHVLLHHYNTGLAASDLPTAEAGVEKLQGKKKLVSVLTVTTERKRCRYSVLQLNVDVVLVLLVYDLHHPPIFSPQP